MKIGPFFNRYCSRLLVGLFTLASLFWSSLSHAIDLDLPAQLRMQIRNQINTCGSNFFVPSSQSDDSVGIPFSAASPAEFKMQIAESLKKFGKEKYTGGVFYVLGTPMHTEGQLQNEYSQIIKDLGLTEYNVKVKVLSVPSRLIEEESVKLADHLIQRTKYFFPSFKRDYQKPQESEIVSGYASTAVLEAPTVLFLFGTLPLLDANVTLISHAVTLGAYTIYSKSMLNWLLRSGTKDPNFANIELFFKQMLLSAPFVLNYNVFGRFSEILGFYSANGWMATMAAFPNELASFVTTQGLTLVIQTVFYSQVITKGFGGWVDRQVGETKSQQARALRPWLQMPILMLDAVLLAMASSQWGDPLFTLGPAEFNWGHASLLAMTATMSMFFNQFPKALDSTFPLASWVQSTFNKYKTWLFEPSRDFKSPLFRRDTDTSNNSE